MSFSKRWVTYIFAISIQQVFAQEINWKVINQSKKIDAGVNQEKTIERDRIRFTEKIEVRGSPLFNRQNIELEGARLRRVDQKTDELIAQIQHLIKREKQKFRIGELKMRLAELYYDRSKFMSIKESEQWAQAVDKWNALTPEQRAKTPRPILKTPQANKVRQKSLELYQELEADSHGPDHGKSMMIERDEVIFFLAMTYMDLGETKKAIPYFEELTKKYPNSDKAALAKLSLADAYFDSNNYKQALPWYLAAASSTAPDFARLKAYAVYRAAWCYTNMQEYKKSVQAFLKTVELSKVDKSSGNLGFIREAYGDLASAFAYAAEYNEGWIYFREKVRNKDLLEQYELTAAQVAKDRGHFKIAEFFYTKLLSRSPTAAFARDLAIDRAENAKRSGNMPLYAQKLGELLRDYGASSAWLKAQKMDAASEKAMNAELVALVRRETKNYHQTAQKKNDKNMMRNIRPLYEVYFQYVPNPNSDTPENISEMRYYYSDLLYDIGEFAASADSYALITSGKYETLAAFNRILAYREAAKKDKKYSDMLITATNQFVQKYPNDKRAGDLMYASATEAFESGAKEQSMQTLHTIVTRFASTDRGVDAAERILFLDEKNENYDAIIGDSNTFLANAALMKAGGDKLRSEIADIRVKTNFKKLEKMPEENKSEQSAKGAAFLAAAPQFNAEFKEKALQNAVAFFKRADDKDGTAKAQAELVKYFPKSQYAKNIYLGRADDLLEKAEFTEALSQYDHVLKDFKGDTAEKEKMLGNTFFVKAHLEDSVIPELHPTHSLHADTLQVGRDYLKEFKTGSIKDFIVTVLAFRQGASLGDLDEYKRLPGLSEKTRKLLDEAEVIIKVRAHNVSAYPGLLKRFAPNSSYSQPVKLALAEIAFEQVEPKYKDYAARKIAKNPARTAQTLTEKVQILGALEKSYKSLVSYGDATYALKSLERLSDSYKNLSDELKGISDKDAKEELDKFAKSFEDKSKSFIELCLDKAKELKIRGAGADACRQKAAAWNPTIAAVLKRSVPDVQWIPKLDHKRELTRFAEASFKQNREGAFLLAQDLLERSPDKMSADEKFYIDFLAAVLDWRGGRNASAEASLLDLSSRASDSNKRTVAKDLASIYLQVGDYAQAASVLTGIEEDGDVRMMKETAAIGSGEGKTQ